MAYLWGIDLGGTKVEGAIVDSSAPGKPVARLRIPTEASKGYEHICRQIAEVVRRLQAESGLPLPPRIGMGTPGAIDPPTGAIKNSNTQCLNGQPLERDVFQLTQVPFVLANDANCLALAEASHGAARGFPTVFGVILGTGVGGGLIVDGKVLNGCHGIAGEWGQIVLDPNGPPSNYGTRGTIEALIAGPALERFYEARSGHKRLLRDIAASAATDPDAQATLDHLTETLARALAIIINVFDPHAIVLGGGVGNIDVLYTPAMRDKIAARIFNPRFEAALLKPTLGDSAGVFGAAMLTASASH